LGKTKVGDEGVKILAALTALVELHLSGNAVSDEEVFDGP
jgi:hypothetical protein